MKRGWTYLLFVVFIIVNLFNFYMIFNLNIPLVIGTGNVANSGTVSLFIEGGVEPNYINISSPENITYNFDIGEVYLIALNVSSNFEVEDWWYDLYDLKNDELVYDNVPFTPNTSIEAVRWGNRLEVFATDSIGVVYTDNVTFYVSVPNSAPIIEHINESILVCEGDWLSYQFNISDVDEDRIYTGISPQNPFYVLPILAQGPNITAEIYSGILEKKHIGEKTYVVSASDGEYVDTKNTNISVIEINHAPDLENIGVQTVYTQGENSTFEYQVNVSDLEDGIEGLKFNISFLDGSDLFGINSTGFMNYTPDVSEIGVYEIIVCVSDSGLTSVHENISFCGQDGSNMSSCDRFELTITNANRPPVIIDYSPLSLDISRSGTSTIEFEIEKYDPDGTTPDAYWYVDGVLKQYDSGELIDSFSYNFGCGVSGVHYVRAEITDGLENHSITWNVNVELVVCDDASGGGSGGGGGGGPICNPEWICEQWSLCQRADRSFDLGILKSESYREILDYCRLMNLDSVYCGYQIRDCMDINNCLSLKNKPDEIQGCYYTENPSCFDGIKNCHSGGCELLVDCGGPCKPCPTCSDGIQNQGELGIDCGGPCPPCPPEIPLIKQPWMLYVLVVIGIGVLIIVIIKLKRIKEYKKGLKGGKYEKK